MSYFTVEEDLKLLHIQIPKALLFEKKYTEEKRLSNDAKILYGFFLDRMRLSIKNQWYDKNNRIYIKCDQVTMSKVLGCTEKKARKIRDELISFELLEEVKNGQGLSNFLYPKKVEVTVASLENYIDEFTYKVNVEREKERERVAKYRKDITQTVGNTLNGQNDRSRTVKMTVLEQSNRPYSNNDFSNTDSVVVVVCSIKDTQKDSSKTTSEKLLEISKQIYMSDKTKALIYRFIENNILLSEKQISMLEKMEYKVCETALDLTIAQDGHTFSYFYKIYKTEEQKAIDEFVDEFYIDPKDTFVQKEDIKSEETPIVDDLEESEEIQIGDTEDFEKGFYERALKQEWRVTKPTYQVAKKYAEKNNLFCPTITNFL